MKEELLPILQCPMCEGALDVHRFRADKPHSDDLEEGLLICQACAWPYPIADGIPRLLPNSFRRERQFRREFSFELERLSFRNIRSQESARFERLHRLTARAFGYEWNTYKTTSLEEDALTFFWLTGADPLLYQKIQVEDVFTYYPQEHEIEQINPSRIVGKRVLEVGCGMGKYVKVVSEHAKEVIGLDISGALTRAREQTRGRANVHLVQGNILTPPVRRSTMDFVYSVGVLHHTPDCHQSFLRSASLVRPGGQLAVWLYPAEPNPLDPYARRIHWIQDDLLRPVTCRMPPRLLYHCCSLLGRLTYVRDRYAEQYRNTGSRWAYRIAAAAGAVAVGSHKDPEIAAFLNFDWYSPQYRSYHTEKELLEWYREAGFKDVKILLQRVSGIGTAGRSAAIAA